MSGDWLESIVQDINKSVVSSEEQLSDKVYHYDAQEKVFELASDYEQRAAEKEQVQREAAAISMNYVQYRMKANGEEYENSADVFSDADRNLEALMKGDTADMESYLQGMVDRDQSPEMTAGAEELLTRIEDFKDRHGKTPVQEQVQEDAAGMDASQRDLREDPDKGAGAWSVKTQGIDSVQEEDSGKMQEKQSAPEMGKEGHAVSDSRAAVKAERSERDRPEKKSVLGALRDKKEQVRIADAGRKKQQKAQNRPRTRNDVSI